MSQISQAPPPTSHSDHSHLRFNSNHLHLINTQLNQHYLSTHLTSVSCPISLTRSGLTPTIQSYLPQDYLPPVPQIAWRTRDVLKWGNQCFPDCFPSLPRPSPPATPILSLNATSIESPVDQQSVDIPEEYSHFSDVFCRRRPLNYLHTGHGTVR